VFAGESRLFRLAAAAALAFLGGLGPAWAECPIRVREVPEASSGVSFRHSDGSSGQRYIVETVASGLATLDYDGDELTDVYFLSGTPLPGTKVDVQPRNRLFRNLGNWKFVDVTGRAGVGRAGFGLGVAAADYDNDGHTDIYASNFGPNAMFHNNGDGTFTNVTATAGTAAAHANKVGAGVCFLDADKDGCLDLFVANYLDFSYEKHAPRTYRGVPIYRGPEFYQPWPSILYRNLGDGTFADASKDSGVSAPPGWGMGLVAADYDNDGSTDVFVANDSWANFLWHNDGTGHFREVGLAAGIGYDFSGNAHGNMGVDCADYNNDGLLDFYVTAYQTQSAALFRNLGRGLFQDVALTSGAGEGTRSNVTWGCGLVDFDNDGNRDLFIARGHLLDNVERFDDSTSYHAHNVLLRNTGGERFVDVSKPCGLTAVPKHSSRGVAFDDLDNDGRIDVVILNSRQPPTILRNESPGDNHWVQVRLRGVKSNRDGVGARVKVVAGDLTRIDEVHGGRGYQSHSGTRLHFGLGKHDRVDRIEVRWIGGGVDVVENIGVDRLVMISEGESVAEEGRPAPSRPAVRPAPVNPEAGAAER
jgi:hypothetical protein